MKLSGHILYKLKVLACAMLFFFSAMVSAQQPGLNLSTQNKKARTAFFDAIESYNLRDYERALIFLEKAIKADPGFPEAFILKGDIKSDMRLLSEAIEAYQSALSINPDFAPNLYYIIGNLDLKTGNYFAGKQNYLKFISYRMLPESKHEKAIKGIADCEFGIHAMENPVPFSPVNLGDSINTCNDEYINTITADNQKIYFTRKDPRDKNSQSLSQSFEEDFYFSVKTQDSLWHKAINLGPPINTYGNEGAMTISPDGRFLFFAACDRPEGLGSCDIYWSKREGERWTEPENLGEMVNSSSWDSQPSFSSDGKTLYFVSKRPGGKGSSDIWKTILLPDGQWTPPQNLGDSINTPMEEQTPFIHSDDQTLYFASRGFSGMGGLDLFVARKNSDGQWGKAINLGYPINTCSDELTLVVNAQGEMAYISSDKLGGKGKQDIYSFKLYQEARPNPVMYFKGIVYNKESKQRLEAHFELTDLSNGNIVVRSNSDPLSGEFFLILPTNKEFALNVARPGFLFYSDHFSLTGYNSILKPFEKNIPLQEIRLGETVVLKNIFFDTDKFVLKDESKVELQRLVELLQKNPRMRIEISGHTDNVGTLVHNEELSLNRAKAVFDYLQDHGIISSRLTYAGYGMSKPVDTNETEQGRANNRRTEFKITGF